MVAAGLSSGRLGCVEVARGWLELWKFTSSRWSCLQKIKHFWISLRFKSPSWPSLTKTDKKRYNWVLLLTDSPFYVTQIFPSLKAFSESSYLLKFKHTSDLHGDVKSQAAPSQGLFSCTSSSETWSCSLRHTSSSLKGFPITHNSIAWSPLAAPLIKSLWNHLCYNISMLLRARRRSGRLAHVINLEAALQRAENK